MGGKTGGASPLFSPHPLILFMEGKTLRWALPPSLLERPQREPGVNAVQKDIREGHQITVDKVLVWIDSDRTPIKGVPWGGQRRGSKVDENAVTVTV